MADVQRFLQAQETVYMQALAEIRAGKKAGHWMWFMFPQIQGLGRSTMAQSYAIADLEEAQAYLQNPILAARLENLVAAVLTHSQLSAENIFGATDALKLRSCMTLFSLANPDIAMPFLVVLKQKFDAEPCQATLAILGISPSLFSTLVHSQ
mgnify:CR=1 FL=1